jgi:hypothetical protein
MLKKFAYIIFLFEKKKKSNPCRFSNVHFRILDSLKYVNANLRYIRMFQYGPFSVVKELVAINGKTTS